MRTIFRALLHLYPAHYRNLLGAEMQNVFEQGAREHRNLGPASYVRFMLSELGALVLDASKVRLGKTVPMAYFNTHALVDGNLPEEVLDAQNQAAVNLNRLLSAISHHQFTQARFYSIEEYKAQDHLRRLKVKYGITE